MADAFPIGGVAQPPAERLHTDMDVDRWAVERFYERRKEIEIPAQDDRHARGMEAIRKIQRDLIRRQKQRGETHDGRRAEGSKDGTHRGVHGDPKEGGTRARNAREEKPQGGKTSAVDGRGRS